MGSSMALLLDGYSESHARVSIPILEGAPLDVDVDVNKCRHKRSNYLFHFTRTHGIPINRLIKRTLVDLITRANHFSANPKNSCKICEVCFFDMIFQQYFFFKVNVGCFTFLNAK